MFNQLYQQPNPTFEILTKLVSTSYTYWTQLLYYELWVIKENVNDMLWYKCAIPSVVENSKPIAVV